MPASRRNRPGPERPPDAPPPAPVPQLPAPADRSNGPMPKVRPNLPSLTFDELSRAANAFARSGFYPQLTAPTLNQSVARAFTILLVGQELGVSTGQAMANIHLIEGKPTFAAALLGALVKRHPGYDYRVVEQTDQGATIEWFEVSSRLGEDGWPLRRSIGFSEFTADDAAGAQLLGKQNWKRYPKAMYFARALTAGVRTHAPDVFNGPIYTQDEIEAGDDAAEIGQVIVESEPLTEVLDDGSIVVRATGEVVMPGTDEHVEGEVIPPDSVNKAPESDSGTGETVVDVTPEETGEASETASEDGETPRSGDGGSDPLAQTPTTPASPPASGPTTGSAPETPNGSSEASEAPDAPAAQYPVISQPQLRLLQSARKRAGLEEDSIWRVVLRSCCDVASASAIPREAFSDLLRELNRLEMCLLDDKPKEWQHLLDLHAKRDQASRMAQPEKAAG